MKRFYVFILSICIIKLSEKVERKKMEDVLHYAVDKSYALQGALK